MNQSARRTKIIFIYSIISSICIVILLALYTISAMRISETKGILSEKEKQILNFEKKITSIQEENRLLHSQIEELEDEKELTQSSAKADDYYRSEQAIEPQGNNPPNAFTIGSTQEHVKKIMGSPKSVTKDSITHTWWYDGMSWISFNLNTGLVESFHDSGNYLKTE
jgi:cell division protein FtsB